jgi:hypothetical protein
LKPLHDLEEMLASGERLEADCAELLGGISTISPIFAAWVGNRTLGTSEVPLGTHESRQDMLQRLKETATSASAMHDLLAEITVTARPDLYPFCRKMNTAVGRAYLFQLLCKRRETGQRGSNIDEICETEVKYFTPIACEALLNVDKNGQWDYSLLVPQGVQPLDHAISFQIQSIMATGAASNLRIMDRNFEESMKLSSRTWSMRSVLIGVLLLGSHAVPYVILGVILALTRMFGACRSKSAVSAARPPNRLVSV